MYWFVDAMSIRFEQGAVCVLAGLCGSLLFCQSHSRSSLASCNVMVWCMLRDSELLYRCVYDILAVLLRLVCHPACFTRVLLHCLLLAVSTMFDIYVCVCVLAVLKDFVLIRVCMCVNRLV